MEVTYLDSILDTVKKMLGLDPSYDAFDTDVIVNVNSALMTLTQLGVGPDSGYAITGADETWTDFLGEERVDLEGIKQYVYFKTRLGFDPPANSSVMESMKNSCNELEWRLNVRVD